jgi:hypothetical protein
VGGAAPVEAPKKKGSGLIIGGVVAVLLAGGGAAVVLSQKKPVEPPKPVVPVVATPPKPVEPPPKPVAPPKPTQFTMSISTQPAGAEVFNGAERLGTTPCNVTLAASETPVELMLKKKGYRDQPLKVVPDRDHDFVADLMAAAKPTHAPAKTPKSTAPVATTPTPPVTKPEAPKETPKPAGKLRDLKDPFAN